MNDFMKLNNGAIVSCGDCNFYDVYMIDIDDDRVELLEYDDDGRMSEDDTTILSL